MKPIAIHPFSALAGAGLLGIVLLAAGAAQAQLSVHRLPPCSSGLVRVAGIPTPQQMMRVLEGQPLTVPSGKLFVVTGLGLAQILSGYGAYLKFDGQTVLSFFWSGEVATFVSIPPGFVAHAGSVVSVDTQRGGAPNAVVSGYLVDA